MNRLLCVFITAGITLSFNAQSQTDVDALRYSMTSFGGTARSLSMGGAFGAVGSDFTSLSGNPAGIAIYRKSEFSFSPSVIFSKAESEFFDKNRFDYKDNFNISNLGIVLAHAEDGESGYNKLKGISLGIGYNRVSNYNSSASYEAINPNNSLLDYYAERAKGNFPSLLQTNFPFDVNLAYQAFLIGTNTALFPDSMTYYSAILHGGANQKRRSDARGSMGETDFTLGFNLDNNLFLGITLGIPILSYTEHVRYEEVDVRDTINNPYSNLDFKSFKLAQDVTTSGTGVNMKLGIIYRIDEWMRLGFAFHSPSWFKEMSDDYSSSITSVFANGTSYKILSPKGAFDYSLRTPMKAITSAAFIFKTYGLIGIDYEYVDYSTSKLNSLEYAFFDENDIIKEKYKGTSNFRLGTEWKYLNYAFRGGFAYYGSPFKNDTGSSDIDYSRISYTGGLGYALNKAFIDLGYAMTKTEDFYQPYTLKTASVQGVKLMKTESTVILSLRWRF